MSLRSVVVERWIAFTERLEGGVPNLYNDRAGQTTIAYGNLVNSPSAVAGLPLEFPGGIPASIAAKVMAFHIVNNDRSADWKGWRYAATLSPLRMTEQGMLDLAMARLRVNHTSLCAQLPDFDDANACLQTALHSWAWACGTRASFPKMMAALKVGDYETASVEIHIDENLRGPDGKFMFDANGNHVKNAGLVPRNVANRILMRNAAYVRDNHLDPDTLDWLHDMQVSNEITKPSYVPPLPEEVTGSGGTIHPSYFGDNAPITDDDDTKS